MENPNVPAVSMTGKIKRGRGRKIVRGEKKRSLMANVAARKRENL